MQLTIKRKLIGAFATVLILMGGLAWVSITRLAGTLGQRDFQECSHRRRNGGNVHRDRSCPSRDAYFA